MDSFMQCSLHMCTPFQKRTALCNVPSTCVRPFKRGPLYIMQCSLHMCTPFQKRTAFTPVFRLVVHKKATRINACVHFSGNFQCNHAHAFILVADNQPENRCILCNVPSTCAYPFKRRQLHAMFPPHVHTLSKRTTSLSTEERMANYHLLEGSVVSLNVKM
jgi:hypothetical protein